MTASKASRRVSAVTRFLAGLVPPPEGGPPAAFLGARARLAGFTYAAIGLAVGCVTAFVVVLIVFALPNIPTLIAGFAGGALIGAALAVTLASRFPIVRKGGGIVILLLPLLLLAAPFLLVAFAVAALVRTRPKTSGASPASRTSPAVEILPKRRRSST